MDLHRYKKSDTHVVARELKDYLGLDHAAGEKIKDFFWNQSRFTVMERIKQKPVKPLLRLTVPFYLIYWIVLLLAMPLKWLLTGKSDYSYESGPYAFLRRWSALLNL